MMQGSQSAHWILLLSAMLLICFFAMSMVNLSSMHKESTQELSLKFSAWSQREPDGSLPQMMEKARSKPAQDILRTNLSEEPYWVYARIPSDSLLQHNQMFFRSRHLVQSSCWSEGQYGEITPLNLRTVQGRLQAIDLRGQEGIFGVLCQFRFIGPASLQMGLQTQAAFSAESLVFEKRQGFLEGVLYLMIGLVALAAVMTRNSLFVAYGFWLFASLRMVAMSEGWDNTFLGFELGPNTLPKARMLAMAMYFTSTLWILMQLFSNLRRESWLGVLRALQFASVSLIVLALFASYSTFLELMWPMSLVGICVVVLVVVQHFLYKKDRVAIYYMASMIATLTGVVAEVLAAWFDQTFLLRYFNTASMTILASIMTAVALAEFLRKAHRQQQVAAEEIKVAHERLASVFDIAPSAMFTCSDQGALLSHNKQFTDLFLNREGKPTLDFLQPQRLGALFNLLEQPGKSSRRELPVVVGEGQTRWFELVVSRDQHELVGVISDFTVRKDKELALQYQATHDELTGALNRRGLQNCVHTKLQKGATNFIFYCLDIRHFSKLMSAYGLAVSDLFLKAFYTELYRYMNTHGEVARVHVDQFVVLVSQKDMSKAEESFDAFLQQIDTVAFQLDGRSILSQVLVCVVNQGIIDNVLDVIDTVEVSMREAKLKAKNNSNVERVVFDQSQTRRLLEQSRTIRSLGDQRLPAGLTLAWQPILSTRHFDGPLYAEALLRIKGEDGKLNSAGFLLEACERGGHTAFLDNWVLTQSLQFLNENAHALTKLSVLSINVSPGSLNDEVFLQDTLALLKAHQVTASKLCLEITEVGSVVNLQAVQQFIEQVRTLGVRIALDDFGAGYSNFRYAMDLRADAIKIDGSIIKNICHSTESHAVTTAIVGLAHDLGCKCVAEWVEDLHTLRELKELGVDYAQGYVVSPAVECTRFLNLNSPLDLIEDQSRVRMIQEVVGSVTV